MDGCGLTPRSTGPAGKRLWSLLAVGGAGPVNARVTPQATLVDGLRIEDFQPRFGWPLVSMWRESFEHGVGIVDPHPLAKQLEYFESVVLPQTRVRIALVGAELVGFIASTSSSVAHLYVAIPHIGRGIGSCLLSLAKRESSGSLWLYTFAQNVRARAFYERHGFTDIGHGFDNMWKLEDIKYVWCEDEGVA